jgi:hypothetical protein
MNETGIGRDQTLIADDQAAKVPQPGKRAFHDPPPPVSSQLAPVLMGRSLVIPSRRDDGLNAPPSQPGQYCSARILVEGITGCEYAGGSWNIQ